MKLSPKERSILAYFPSSGKAQQAVKELEAAGYTTVSLDRVSRYGVEEDAGIDYALAGMGQTISGLTLYSTGAAGGDFRVLRAVDPAASGYGAVDYGTAGGHAFLVTVVTGEEKVDRAVEILKKHGATV